MRITDPVAGCYWAVIPAAGVGRRMGGTLPKQYLQLNGRMLIDHSIARLLEHPKITAVCVVLSGGDPYWKNSAFFSHPDVLLAEGGAERADSVLAGLQALLLRANATDRVLVHDAARPCVRQADISCLIEQGAATLDGALLAVPVTDTMKRGNGVRVDCTVDRDNLWHAFTPQLFPLGLLQQVLANALEAKIPVTDEASAMEAAGYHPLLVSGARDNIKVTQPDDLALANYFIDQQLLEK